MSKSGIKCQKVGFVAIHVAYQSSTMTLSFYPQFSATFRNIQNGFRCVPQYVRYTLKRSAYLFKQVLCLFACERLPAPRGPLYLILNLNSPLNDFLKSSNNTMGIFLNIAISLLLLYNL